MGRGDEYRREGERCRRQSAQAPIGGEAEAWLQLAKNWLQLADDAERQLEKEKPRREAGAGSFDEERK